jgi:flagellar assembly protein FliH
LSSKIIPKNALGSVQKLALNDLGQASGVAHVEAPRSDAGQRDAEQVRAQAYKEGLEAGRSEARAAAAAEHRKLEAVIAGMNEMMQEFEQRLAVYVLALSLELAKLIVRHSLRVKPDLVMSVVREAIASLPGFPEQAVLVLHPDDVALVRAALADDPTVGKLPWKVVEDSHIERGGCRLEAAGTEVDATLETRWRHIVASLGRDDEWIDVTL